GALLTPREAWAGVLTPPAPLVRLEALLRPSRAGTSRFRCTVPNSCAAGAPETATGVPGANRVTKGVWAHGHHRVPTTAPPLGSSGLATGKPVAVHANADRLRRH